MIFRNMKAHDLDAVMLVQEKAYNTITPENRDVMESKFRFGMEFCFVCIVENDIGAYLLAHPWESASIPPLHMPLTELPEHCDSIYLHDMAVHPNLHGKQAGRKLFAELEKAIAKSSVRKSHLTAVQNAEHFWQKMGYLIDEDPDFDLSSYGKAYLMRRDFQA